MSENEAPDVAAEYARSEGISRDEAARRLAGLPVRDLPRPPLHRDLVGIDPGKPFPTPDDR